MTELEIDNMLRELDPTTGHEFEGLASSGPARDLLDQVVDRTPHQARRSRRRPATRASVGSVAVVIALVVAVVLVSKPGTPSASAAVNTAAQATADASSGQLDIEVRMAVLPESDSTPSGSSVKASLAFDGPDFDLSNRASLGNDSGPFVSRVIYVGGVGYVQNGSGSWSESQTDSSEYLASSPGQSGEALQVLLAQAGDFTHVGSKDGTETYSGTLGFEVLEKTDPDSLPLGVRMIYERRIPEDILVRVEVVDGHLASVVVHLVGDVDGYGFVDITISSEYSQLGEPQSIEAPR